MAEEAVQYLNDTVKVHIAVDSQGDRTYRRSGRGKLASVGKRYYKNGPIEFEGISRICDCRWSRYDTVDKQIEKSHRLVDELSVKPAHVHYSNSAYALWHGAGDGTVFDMGLEFTELILPMET